MTNNMNITLETDKTNLKIKINGVTKKKISINNKVINTKEIYDMLKYSTENKYILNCKKMKEEDTKGKNNEVNRLYNYVYDLFETIVNSVNDINKK